MSRVVVVVVVSNVPMKSDDGCMMRGIGLGSMHGDSHSLTQTLFVILSSMHDDAIIVVVFHGWGRTYIQNT